MDDGRLERIERRMDDLDQRESAMERTMDSGDGAFARRRWARSSRRRRASHMRASWRHNLLALRSMIDHWAERLDDGPDDHSDDPDSVRATARVARTSPSTERCRSRSGRSRRPTFTAGRARSATPTARRSRSTTSATSSRGRARAHLRRLRRRPGRRRRQHLLVRPDRAGRRGACRSAGITWIGIMPTHRRQGALRQLMTRMIEDARRVTSPSPCCGPPRVHLPALRLRPGDARSGDRPRARSRRLSCQLRSRPVGRAACRHRRGPACSSDPYSRPIARDPGLLLAHATRGGTSRCWPTSNGRDAVSIAVLRGPRVGPGTPDAYAMYRVRQEWANSVPGSELNVRRSWRSTALRCARCGATSWAST